MTDVERARNIYCYKTSAALDAFHDAIDDADAAQVMNDAKPRADRAPGTYDLEIKTAVEIYRAALAAAAVELFRVTNDAAAVLVFAEALSPEALDVIGKDRIAREKYYWQVMAPQTEPYDC